MARLNLQPITLREAMSFTDRHHRHHKAPQGGLFAVAVNDGADVVGVAVIGRPVARMLDNGYTAEVTRLCTLGDKNACSILYAAAWRACRALGYRRLVTYTLASEGGVSLRAAGWKVVGQTKGGEWGRTYRPRVTRNPEQKLLWEAAP